jgi:rSAM/selenodomain-associated transferase 1
MAKAPRPGLVKTRLHGVLAPEQAAALHRCFVEDVVGQALELPGVRVAVVCPEEDRDLLGGWLPGETAILSQAGQGLAAGLAFALEQFAAAGFRRIVLRNSDSPNLPAARLSEALRCLEESDVVVGPTEDGGYYLVGARQAHPGLFDATTMGTSSAIGALRETAQSLGLSRTELAPWYDVDTPDDLWRLHADLRREPHRAVVTARFVATSLAR